MKILKIKPSEIKDTKLRNTVRLLMKEGKKFKDFPKEVKKNLREIEQYEAGFNLSHRDRDQVMDILEIGIELAEKYMVEGLEKRNCIHSFNAGKKILLKLNPVMKDYEPMTNRVRTPEEPDYEMDAVRASEDNPNDEPTI